ncbi:hypothetical protein AAIG11_00680 [Anoxynatronum sibiricum]|uniref:Uncharacterized protein n=1 Tax=Anoxynatronum sibiricum TaxID=210623 RepID=A0ABU9VP76_9CLOT
MSPLTDITFARRHMLLTAEVSEPGPEKSWGIWVVPRTEPVSSLLDEAGFFDTLFPKQVNSMNGELNEEGVRENENEWRIMCG